MAAVFAADMPVGSVVASATMAWIKSYLNLWCATNDCDDPDNDYDIDLKLRRGEVQVLRVGDGAS